MYIRDVTPAALVTITVTSHEVVHLNSLEHVVWIQKKYAAYTGISESTLKGYLNSSRQVVPYYFPGGVYYYLNFNSEKSANDFFSDYYVNNQGKTAQYANIYLDEDALIVDSNTIMTFSGDILKRAASADMLEVGTYTIAPDNWKDSSGLYWKYCSKLAVRYKSLELGLTDQGQGVTEDNVRLTSTDASGHEVIDKTVNPLFDYLIDRSAFTTEVEKHKASPTASETVYSQLDVYPVDWFLNAPNLSQFPFLNRSWKCISSGIFNQVYICSRGIHRFRSRRGCLVFLHLCGKCTPVNQIVKQRIYRFVNHFMPTGIRRRQTDIVFGHSLPLIRQSQFQRLIAHGKLRTVLPV